ncbi:MAG: sugar transferase [Oscillospiraceae bacterium]|jgi:lipopolysaccharide/colanic/teichoic acid biosynthesis glycosyltransferase
MGTIETGKSFLSASPEKEESAVSVPQKPLYDFFKRFFDLLLSVLALIVLSPLFLVVSILIKAEDGGNVIYRQARHGRNERIFQIYKFRSMCVDADKKQKEIENLNEADGPIFKIAQDPRITKTGRFLRKTSVDELPQLINIIKGDMSIVGPRPLPTYETERLTESQRQRLCVKPGLTCYWQVSGRSNTSFQEMMELDFKYLRERSLWTDFKIICKTFITVFRGEGAY